MSECNTVNDSDVVSLEVPGKIECRNVVMRTVSAVCKLVGLTGPGLPGDVCVDVLSAVGEAYNNIVLHGYAGRKPGAVQMKIRRYAQCISVEIKDTGASFDPVQAPPPDLTALPESGVGIFLMRSMVDEVSYVAGCPNVLTLVKHIETGAEGDPG